MSQPNHHELKTISAFVLDIDGVLFTGDRPLPGAVDFIRLLHEHRLSFMVLTNNSTRTPDRIAERMQRMGMEVAADNILTSSLAAALYLKKLHAAVTRVYVVGEDGLRSPMSDAGFELADEGPADCVIVGMDRSVTYDKLKRASLLIRSGARFIATNPDTTFPSPEGLVPGAGALIAALRASTGLSPVVIGKPEPTCFELALEKLGADAANAVAVGDRLDTDIEGGRRAGMRTILVLSGVSSASDLSNSIVKPTWVFKDLVALTSALT